MGCSKEHSFIFKHSSFISIHYTQKSPLICVLARGNRFWHGNCSKRGETKKMVQFGTTPTLKWTKPFNWAKAQKRIKIMIKPLADRIVVKPAEAEQKTSSGLFIPDNAKEKPMQGKVVAVGPGRKNDKGEVVAMEVKVGDVVLYGKYSGTEVTVEGENYLIVKESDVIATL